MKAIVKVSKTKTGKTRIVDTETNRKLDKCAMSSFFPAYSVYSVCWDIIDYEKMCTKFLKLPNITITK